jgi:hypothetical protein
MVGRGRLGATRMIGQAVTRYPRTVLLHTPSSCVAAWLAGAVPSVPAVESWESGCARPRPGSRLAAAAGGRRRGTSARRGRGTSGGVGRAWTGGWPLTAAPNGEIVRRVRVSEGILRAALPARASRDAGRHSGMESSWSRGPANLGEAPGRDRRDSGSRKGVIRGPEFIGIQPKRGTKGERPRANLRALLRQHQC